MKYSLIPQHRRHCFGYAMRRLTFFGLWSQYLDINGTWCGLNDAVVLPDIETARYFLTRSVMRNGRALVPLYSIGRAVQKIKQIDLT